MDEPGDGQSCPGDRGGCLPTAGEEVTGRRDSVSLGPSGQVPSNCDFSFWSLHFFSCSFLITWEN